MEGGRWGESVTHTAGHGVDYRTPEEIFLSPQTVSGRGLTTAEPPEQTFTLLPQYTTLRKETESAEQIKPAP